MESINGRETLLNPKDTYCVFVGDPFSDSILSNLSGANQATHFSPPGDRAFENREPIRIRRTANIVRDADSLQSPSDQIQ